MHCNIRPLLLVTACALTQPLTVWSAAPDCRAAGQDPLASEACAGHARSAYPLAHLFDNPSESRTSLALAAVLLGGMAMRARLR